MVQIHPSTWEFYLLSTKDNRSADYLLDSCDIYYGRGDYTSVVQHNRGVEMKLPKTPLALIKKPTPHWTLTKKDIHDDERIEYLYPEPPADTNDSYYNRACNDVAIIHINRRDGVKSTRLLPRRSIFGWLIHLLDKNRLRLLTCIYNRRNSDFSVFGIGYPSGDSRTLVSGEWVNASAVMDPSVGHNDRVSRRNLSRMSIIMNTCTDVGMSGMGYQSLARYCVGIHGGRWYGKCHNPAHIDDTKFFGTGGTEIQTYARCVNLNHPLLDKQRS